MRKDTKLLELIAEKMQVSDQNVPFIESKLIGQMSNAAELVCGYFIEVVRYILLLPKESNDQFETAKISIANFLDTDFNVLARDIRSYDILSGILLEASLFYFISVVDNSPHSHCFV